MRMWRIFLGASVVAACAVAVACSSSSPSPAVAGTDAAMDVVTTPEDTGTGADVPCVLDPASPATVDGGAVWGCFQAACKTQLTACAADCVCNNAYLTALMGAAANMSMASTLIEMAGSADMAAMTALTCIGGNLQCENVGGDGGTEGGKDGAAGDSATGDSATGDSATGDSATASDAPAEGG
ncbi:MAG: hypothetical protein ACLP1X_24290 [Polyangiaceae bacterium]|jgi:hypothetical protein